MADTETAKHLVETQGTANTQGALADASNTTTKPSTLSTELASGFRASCVDHCAALFRTCAALPGPIVPSPTPTIRSLSDVTLKVIGPCIEGQSENLESLVKQICSGVANDDDAIRVAVKNMVIQEANRKSYSHDKQSVKRESVLDSTREELLWRWEVKKVSCLGEYRSVALAMRSWLKKAQQCMATRLQAVKALQKLTGGNITQKQQAALEKAQQAVMPGAPPVPCEPTEVALPTELTMPQEEVPEDLSKMSPAKAKLPAKERKSDETKEAVDSRGFGSKSGLERSRGVMAMFVQKVPQAKMPSPHKEKDAVVKADDNAQEVLKMQYIIDALQNPGDVNVEEHWQQVLQTKWKPLGRKMHQAHVPGLPPAFARKATAPRDSGQLAKLALGHEHWQGVRTWRRKLLFFPSDGNRPPFYGSFSRRSKAVTSRQFLRKDVDMDYEVLSDEEWEEEPEGEELDGSDGDDDAGMDEEEDTDGFMVADGYLSEDERAQDQGSDTDVWDPAKAKAGLGTDVEPVLHSLVDQPTTSYLNVLLNAKTQGQPVVICRTPGPIAVGEGFKARSVELLQPLQMCLLEMRLAVVPATASLDTTPMETLTALADSAAAAGTLQKEVGPFVDSLSDDAARHKSAIIDAVIEKFATSLPRSRIATVVLPAAVAYCSSCKRWFSLSTMKCLAAQDGRSPALQLLSTVNSASLQRLLNRGALPVQMNTMVGTPTSAGAATSRPSEAIASPGTDKAFAMETKAPLVPKKRRLQPTPVDEHAVPCKQACPEDAAGFCAGTVHADHDAVGDVHMEDNAPPAAGACALRERGVEVANQPTITAAQDSGAATPTPVPQPPQPGQGGMEEWMRDNPDRPRLPGGSDDFCVNRRDNAPLSPIATTHNQLRAASHVMTRQPSRRRKAQQPHQASNHMSKPGPSKLIERTIDDALALVDRGWEKENEGPHDRHALMHASQDSHKSPVLHRDCTVRVRPNFEMNMRAPGAPDLSPPLHSHSRTVASHPIKQLEVSPAEYNDDDDPGLQAALLASIGAEDQVDTPACGVSALQMTKGADSITRSNTSLAAETLQTLALDPLTGPEHQSRRSPTAAGAIHWSTPTAGAQLTKWPLLPQDTPMKRVTAQRIASFTSYQQQKLRRVTTHLQDCMKSTPLNFSSWPALCTFLAMVPSVRDAATLRVAENSIGILDFLKPKWKSAAVFEVPRELLNVCVRACRMRSIEWLHSSAMKSVIAIAMGVVRRSTESDGSQVTDQPGCVNLASLACNEYALRTFGSFRCLLRAMVQAAAALHVSTAFTDTMFAKQALMVLKEILQSSLGVRAAKQLARIMCESTGRTTLHELVLMRQLDEPKVKDLIRSVLHLAFTRVHRQDTGGVPLPSRLLPADCTEWFMHQLLQDLSVDMTPVGRRSEAVDILEALLQAPSCELRGDLGHHFVKALASLCTRSSVMSNTSSMASIQFKSILRGVFLPQSTCLCSRTAPPVFRLCCCLLSTDSCQEMQKLVIHAFRTPLKIPGERSGPNTHQVVEKAVAFYVESCANDPLEDRQKAAVVESAWSALDQMLKRAFAVSDPCHRKQVSLPSSCPRPAASKFTDSDERNSWQPNASRLQGQKRAGAHSIRHKSKGQRMMQNGTNQEA